jgi:hypothetical protein
MLEDHDTASSAVGWHVTMVVRWHRDWPSPYGAGWHDGEASGALPGIQLMDVMPLTYVCTSADRPLSQDRLIP